MSSRLPQAVAASDQKTVIVGKTSNNVLNGAFRIRFALKRRKFKKMEPHYFIIVEKKSGAVVDRIEFTIDGASVSGFDF